MAFILILGRRENVMIKILYISQENQEFWFLLNKVADNNDINSFLESEFYIPALIDLLCFNIGDEEKLLKLI